MKKMRPAGRIFFAGIDNIRLVWYNTRESLFVKTAEVPLLPLRKEILLCNSFRHYGRRKMNMIITYSETIATLTLIVTVIGVIIGYLTYKKK